MLSRINHHFKSKQNLVQALPWQENIQQKHTTINKTDLKRIFAV
jgi:hypothetical protein